jgi:hypothetical protein
MVKMPNNIPKEKQNGLWIPRWMCYLKDLSLAERDCYAFIYSLNENGNECYASRAYLAEYLMCSEDNISDITKKLEKKNYIVIKRIMVPNIDKNGEFINLKKQNIYCISGHMPGYQPPEGFKFKPAFYCLSLEEQIEDGKTPLPSERGKMPLPNEDGKTPLPSERGKTPLNNIVTNNNIIIDNTEIPTTINFEKIQKQAEKRNKDIEKYKKDLRSKENELEMAPNLIIKNELKRQITTIQNRLGKLDPKLITKEELDKKFIEIPPIILYFKIFTNFKWLSERIKDSKDLRYINAVYKATEMTQKQINYFISILNKSIGVKGIKEIEESITPEDIIKLQKGEM